MFTGLIKTTGIVTRIDQRGDRTLAFSMREPFGAALGDSIAVNGICLTVTKLDSAGFEATLSAETLNCTTSKDWVVGTEVNLEPSLRVGDTIGGHFVSGHVDGVGRAVSAMPSGDSTVWEFEVPAALARFVAPKGSITINGVSLTVNTVREGLPSTATAEPSRGEVCAAKGSNSPSYFSVNIIPHTAQVTGFGNMKPGDAVNLEIDLLARYVARLTECA